MTEIRELFKILAISAASVLAAVAGLSHKPGIGLMPRPVAEPLPMESTAAKIAPAQEDEGEEIEAEDREAELELLACVVMAEAGGEDLTGKKLVADVVLNRVADPAFPDTITDVVYQEGQFAVVKNGALVKAYETVSADCYEAVASELVDQISYDVLWFDCGGYLPYGTPAFQHGGHYFSEGRDEAR